MDLHIHRLGTVSTEAEATLLRSSTVGTESELLGLAHCLIGSVLLIREVLLNDVVCLHVDLLVGVGLAVVDLLHTAALLNEESVAVDALRAITSSLLVEVAHLENVLEAVERNLDDLVVGASKEVAEGLDAALVDQVSDLIRLLETARRSVANSPAGLLAGLQIAVGEEVDQRGDNVGVNDGLYLSRVASSDVGDGPAGLLANTVLVRAQKRQETRKSAAVDDDLSLNVISGNDVADRAEGRGLDRGRGVHEELDKAARDTGLDDSLDLVVGSIGEVADGPASVNQDFIVQRVYKLGKYGKRGSNLPRRLALSRVCFRPLGPWQKDCGELTVFQSGWGVLPRQKLLRVQVAFLSMLSLRLSPRRLSRGRRAPWLRT